MKNILCYGDSNTWGYSPENAQRYPFSVRWPGRLQEELGKEFHIFENGLNGRTSVFEDPVEEGRNGRTGFEIALEVASPLDLLIIMLGTNDLKIRIKQSAVDISLGIELLIKLAKKTATGYNGKAPKILIVSPIHLDEGVSKGPFGNILDEESYIKSKLLAENYANVAKNNGCHFLDASIHAQAMPNSDGVHIGVEGHNSLAAAIAETVRAIL